MPLELYQPPGRSRWYLRGTVSLGEKSRPVYETTKLRVRDRDGKKDKANEQRADFLRIGRESEILRELQFGIAAVVTWTQAAADRIARRFALLAAEGRPADETGDQEAAFVLKLTDFFRRKFVDGVAVSELPLVRFPKSVLNAYFKELHVDVGNEVSSMHREHNSYVAVMNYAVEEYKIPTGFPRADLPAYDPLAAPVDKWLYPAEIQLFIEEAERHMKPILACIFGTGRRGGEMPWRLKTDYQRMAGQERLTVGRTKNGDPVSVPLPPFAVVAIDEWLAWRAEHLKDSHPELFLTDKHRPYAKPKRQRGGIFKKAIAGTRERVAQRLEALADDQEKGQNHDAARRLRERALYVRQVTGHWGRHNAASHLFMANVSDGRINEYLGWNDPRSSKRYKHLSEESRREITAHLDFGAAAPVPVKKADEA